MNKSEIFLCEAIDIIEEVLADGGEFPLYPKGTSMLPLIKQGKDSVVLKRRNDSSTVPLYKNEIAFYRRTNGQFVIHRVMKISKDGTYVMCGDNQLVLEKNISKDQIIGYVNKIYKDDKLLSLTSFKYKTYVFFWTFMPFRRCVMFIKRALRFIKRKFAGNK